VLQGIAEARTGRPVVTLIVVLCGLFGLLAASARAEGNPDITAAVTSSTVLVGEPVQVTLSAGNPSSEYGYNLSFRVVLPAGVSYTGGAPVAPTQIADAPNTGETTLIFSNVSDLSPGSTKAITLDLAASPALYDAGDSFPVKAQAFVNKDPRYIPKFDAEGQPQIEEVSATGYTPEVSGTETLKAIDVNLTEPSAEGEILRGVHEHQTVYTPTVTNNGVSPTTGTRLDVYLPAGLEFLGCGGPGMDHTTDAPTNPGSPQEYPGSGPIENSLLAGCSAPQSVETEVVDPDGPGGLPEAVYTHVVWPVGELKDGETKAFPYRAAIPIRANTDTFTGARPSAASGDQAANLDNNSGAEVVDETALVTYATASGTYKGTPAEDAEAITRTAEDWLVHKSASTGALAQGEITTWTLLFQTSEYKFVDDATVTDTLPDGLCPLDETENLTGSNDPADSECDPVPGEVPSADYTTATENADGSWTLTWDKTKLAKLGHTGISDSFTITFPTRTRVDYQQEHLPDGPVLTHDRIENKVHTSASGFARCTAPGTADCSTPGPKIPFDGTDGAPIIDDSQAEQVAGEAHIEKEVAKSGSDCLTAEYTTEKPHYHPGDHVCWLLRVDFPAALNTEPEALSDFLPEGTKYVAGSDQPTGGNTVTATTDDSKAGEGVLSWTITGSTVPSGDKVFEHVLSTVVEPVGAPRNGDLTGNLFKFASENTQEESFPQRDEAEFILDTPELALVKGVEKVVRGGSTVDGPYGPNVDNRPVEGGDEVTYRVDVENKGSQDAVGVEVWDLLPEGFDCTELGGISDAGSCVDASPRDHVAWTLAELAAGASKKLTYTVTVPADVGPGRTFVNEAGVRHYAGETNVGGEFTYTPFGNIDPEVESEANAPEAKDGSDVFTAGATVEKTRTTSVSEGGNNASSQATIGETIAYEVTAKIPEGTTLGGSGELVDTLNSAEGQNYVPKSAKVTLNGVEDPSLKIDESGPAPKVLFPAGYENAPGSGTDVVVLSFETVVANQPANPRGASLGNEALLKWTDPSAGAQSTEAAKVSTTVVEPLISQQKSDDVNPDAVDPGDVVTYTVTTSNSAAANVSTAHDVEISDLVPKGLIVLGVGNVPLGDGEEVPGSAGAIWHSGSRTITMDVASLAPGASATLTYRAEIEDPATAGAVLKNEAKATAASLDESVSGRRTAGSGYEAESSDQVRIGGASITKSVSPDEATPGDPLTYRLKVTIPPSIDLYDTTVVDVLPAGVEFDGYVSETCLSGCPLANPINRYDAADAAAGSKKIAWDLGDIPALSEPQEIEFTYEAHLLAENRSIGGDVAAADTEVNAATVNSDLSDAGDSFDPTEIPDEFDDSSEEVKATVTVVEPQLTIDKQIAVGAGGFGDGPVTAHSDDTMRYRLVVHNEGDSPAYDAEVTDALDPALTNVQVVSGPGFSVVTPWTEATHSMTLGIAGPVAPGGSVTIEYTAEFVAAALLHDGQTVENTAHLPLYYGVPKAERDTHAGEPSWEFREYEDGSDSTQAVLDFPTFTIEKTTGLPGNPETGTAEVHQGFPWRIVVTNTSGTAGAEDVVVRDLLPVNWTYVAGSTEFDGSAAPNPEVNAEPGGEELEWTLASLPAGASVVVTFDAKPQLGAIEEPGTGSEANVNEAWIAAARDEAGNTGNGDGPYETAPDEATATLAVPALTIAKTPDGGSATAGEPSSFSVKVENTGNAPAREVDVEDVLPAGLSYTPGSAEAAPSAGFSESSVQPGPGAGETTVHWAIDSLAAGASVTITVPVGVDHDAADGATLTNTASVTSDELPDPVEDEGSLVVGTEADMAIEKTGAAAYTAGDEYTWHLRVRNLGPSDAQNVVVSDPLPAGTTFVSADAPCAQSGGEVECDLGTVAPGFDQTYDVTVEVDPATTTSPLDNTASVETTTDDPEPGNDESTFGPSSDPIADLSVVKTVSPKAILRKHEATFTILVHNAGPSVAREVELTDPLPPGLEFVSTDEPPCSESGGTVSCDLGDLAAEADATVHVTVRGTVNGIHQNTATATTTTPEPPGGGAPNFDTEDVEVGPVADLQIEKTAPATVAAGGQITWALKVTNNGEDGATGVTIVDPLPAGTVFAAADPGCGEAGGMVTCAVGDLADGESAERHITVTAPVALADTTVLNAATVHGDQGDDEPANNSDEASTQVGPAADVAIVKSGPRQVSADGTVAWTLVASNNGPSTATGVTVKDTLPAGVQLTSATPTQGSCAAGAAVECQLGTLAKGGSAQIQIVAHVPASLQGSTLTNSATIGAEQPDPDPGNNSSGARTVVGPPPANDHNLTIEKTVDGPDSVAVGETLRYAIVVANSGPATATGVKVVDTLPSTVEYVSAALPGGKCTLKGSVLTCAVGTLAPGEQKRVAVTVRAVKAGKVRNTATVSGSVADSNPNDNSSSASARVTMDPAKLTIAKKRLGHGAVAPGDRVRYLIQVRNVSRSDALEVEVCDRLPAAMSFASLGRAKLTHGDACWRIDRLAAGAARTYRLAARVEGGAGAGVLRNVAYVVGENAPRRQGVAAVHVKSAGPGRGGGVTG
jgi:uncharacterized repeat protein (TIGR01451 family)/fimbrial isopeptide formation D2 family protein